MIMRWWASYYDEPQEDEKGDWVKYEDVKKLEDEITELKEKIEQIGYDSMGDDL